MSKHIVVLPHKVLRKKALVVKESEFNSKNLDKIIDRMSKVLAATTDGIGIAAPQVGVSKRIFIASEEALSIDNGGEEDELKKKNKKQWEHFVFINPEVIKKSTKKIDSSEGCLSVPGKYGMVARADKIKVRAFDRQGKIFERGATKLFARLLQHELDHLDGILFIDKATRLVDVNKEEL